VRDNILRRYVRISKLVSNLLLLRLKLAILRVGLRVIRGSIVIILLFILLYLIARSSILYYYYIKGIVSLLGGSISYKYLANIVSTTSIVVEEVFIGDFSTLVAL
jgi:hypothetical protein